MAVRMDQRAMESAIQELNYKITVALNSDSKGEVEGLRWVLTRRAALAIVGMARMLLPLRGWRWLLAPRWVCGVWLTDCLARWVVLILSSLRYSSYKLHAREEAAKRAASSSYSSTGSGSGSAGATTFTVPSRDAGTQTSDGASLTAGSGVDPSLISLG